MPKFLKRFAAVQKRLASFLLMMFFLLVLLSVPVLFPAIALGADSWTTYNTTNSGLAYNYVLSIAIDPSGNKWFGTYGGGVSKLDAVTGTWTTYNTGNSSLASNYVRSVATDSSGNTWIGTDGGGVSKFDGANWTTYNTANSGLASNYVLSIAIDPSGNKWFGTDGGGVSQFTGATWWTYTSTNSGLASNYVNSIAVDSWGGNKWFGTAGGVSKFDGATWTTWTTVNSVLSITTDVSGRTWIGTYGGGVSMLNGATWTTYMTANSGLASNYVRSVAAWGGNKWFGTDGSGVSKFDGGTTWTTYTMANSPLASNYVRSIATELSGTWFGGGTSGGVSVLYSLQILPIPPGSPSYWFTWYDQASPGMQDWVVIANPGITSIDANIYLGSNPRASYTIQPGSRVTPQLQGWIGGPLRIETSGPAITSQRVIYNGSFNEIMGVPDWKLSTQYYFTWYDSQSMSDWILVGNPTTNSAAAQVEIWIGGVLKWSGSIYPGQNVTPQFPGVMNGPVIVKSTNGVKIFSSQRTLFQGSFSEVMGIPQEGLSTDFYFTWYDNQWMKSWILVGNSSTSQAATVTMLVGSTFYGPYLIPPGGRITPQFSAMNGPVKVTSLYGIPIFASERSIYGTNGFEELPGLASSGLGLAFWFPWYDNLTMTSWILVGNPSPATANVTIKIGSSIVYQGQVQPFGRITPQFNLMDGPVLVFSDQNIFASQRAVYNSSFNEIFGTP